MTSSCSTTFSWFHVAIGLEQVLPACAEYKFMVAGEKGINEAVVSNETRKYLDAVVAQTYSASDAPNL